MNSKVLLEKVLKWVVAVCSEMSMGRGCVVSLNIWAIVMPMLSNYGECMKVRRLLKIEITIELNLTWILKLLLTLLEMRGWEVSMVGD